MTVHLNGTDFVSVEDDATLVVWLPDGERAMQLPLFSTHEAQRLANEIAYAFDQWLGSL